MNEAIPENLKCFHQVVQLIDGTTKQSLPEAPSHQERQRGQCLMPSVPVMLLNWVMERNKYECSLCV